MRTIRMITLDTDKNMAFKNIEVDEFVSAPIEELDNVTDELYIIYACYELVKDQPENPVSNKLGGMIHGDVRFVRYEGEEDGYFTDCTEADFNYIKKLIE